MPSPRAVSLRMRPNGLNENCRERAVIDKWLTRTATARAVSMLSRPMRVVEIARRTMRSTGPQDRRGCCGERDESWDGRIFEAGEVLFQRIGD